MLMKLTAGEDCWGTGLVGYGFYTVLDDNGFMATMMTSFAQTFWTSNSKTSCSGKAQFTHNIFAYNNRIKRYSNKNIFFMQYFFLCELKIFTFGQLYFLKPTLKIFLNVTTIFLRKNIFLSKCLFIFLSQNCVPKCCV